MPENFNILPYYDDFDETKHFYKVLYRPQVAVQARELTTSESILQQQVKYLGDSIYKHGSMVTPGQIATDPNTHYVRLKPTFGFVGNTPIPINMVLFNNQIIQGQTSGLQAQVVFTTPAINTDSPTLYVKYMNTGALGETVFDSSEILVLQNSTTGLAQVEDSNATGLGISAQIDEGVYYIWGYFVRVEKQYLLLNKYSNVVSGRVGLQIVESIITPEEDPSLDDNSQGTPNPVAPGAHRYKIDLILENKDLTDTSDDNNFVELIRLINSVTQIKVSTDTYSVINKELAQRMSDTNGDFAVRNFSIDIREHLDTSFITSGTVVSATVATSVPTLAMIKLANSASATDDFYTNMQLYLSNGTGAGQKFNIVGYVGSTKTASLDEDFAPNQVADATTAYIITDPTKVNRGINPPPPFGTGDASKLAVGMESGRAYVDGYRIDTLATTYVTMDKARDSAQTVNSLISTPVGNYILVKNLKNMPLAAASAFKNFLTINFSSAKANGSFNQNQNGLGTARVHSVEYVQGTNAASQDAVFKMYLFDIQMNTGADINSVRSFYALNDITFNNIGNGINAWGDVCTSFKATNVNGTGLVPGVSITGPSSIGTEILVQYDAINNLILTESNGTNGSQILLSGLFTGPNSTTGTLSSRSQIFNTQSGTLVYNLPQSVVKTVRASDGSVRTSYFVRQMFESQINNSGQYIFNSVPNSPFAAFTTTDYLACVVSSSNSPDIGKIIDLSAYITDGSFTGNPSDTTLTFTILSGVGAAANTIIKLMATVYKTAISEKLKALTSGQIAYPNPTANMSLEKADIIDIQRIIDSGNPAIDADPNNPAHVDIKSRYVFDRGQRDYYYDVGKVAKYPAAPAPSGRILILFTYYAHSGSGDYFSVDSYTNQVDYSLIPSYTASTGKKFSLRDCLDFRPRKDNQSLGFSGTGSSFSATLPASNLVTTDFQYYLPRIDKIYLDQYGTFNELKGTSGLVPIPPADPIDGMMLYTISLNAYTLSTSDMNVATTKNPRYTMHDIGKLETRIANLEYYTNLNQLEQQVSTFQITDTSTGLDRFKNGFVVDNFIGHNVGNVFDSNYNCAIDPTNNILRPVFTQIINTLTFAGGSPISGSSGSGGTPVIWVDGFPIPIDFVNPSTNYDNPSNVLILPHSEIFSVAQHFPTNVININPFAVFTYYGDIALIPPTDTWKSTIQRPDINVADTSALDGYKYLNQWSGVTWGDWQTTWVGQPTTTSTSSITKTSTSIGTNSSPQEGATVTFDPMIEDLSSFASAGQGTFVDTGAGPVTFTFENGQYVQTDGPTSYAATPQFTSTPGIATTATTTTVVSSSQQISQTKVGTQTMTTSQLASQTINNVLVDESISPYMRSRRVEVIGRHFKPNTRLYPFFDGTDVSAFCRPFADPVITPTATGATWVQAVMTWGGDFDPQTNEIVSNEVSPGDTGQTAKLLTGPLADPILTDNIGTCTLFFEIPCTDSIKFRVGTRAFRLTDSPTNEITADSYGDANYTAAGVVDQYQSTITSVYTPETVTKQVSDSQVLTQNLGSTSTSSTSTNTQNGGVSVQWIDPLAQSFLVKEPGGAYLTSISVYFQTTDNTVPITLQIRNMVNGYPGQTILPFSEKTLYPNNPTLSAVTSAGTVSSVVESSLTQAVLNPSDDATVPTTFVFDAPVYVNDATEYAFVLISNSISYNIFTAKLGGTVIGSTSIVSSPPYLGSIFKSQNASTWVPDPTQNLKFIINKAQFDPTNVGTIYLASSSLQPDILLSLPFQTVNGSNIVRVNHFNHMMPKGQNSNSVATLGNIAAGTYNGLTDVQLTGTFSIDNVDLNSYTITVPGAPAASTGRVGPDGVTATKNQQFDSICPIINTLAPTGTSIAWFAKFTSGKSVNNNSLAIQEPYIKDSDWIPISNNTTTDFLAPRMIASDINELTSIVGATTFDRKSFIFKGVLSTNSVNLTPIIDLSRTSMVLINNQIDDPTFANYTLPDMDKGAVVTSTSMDFLTFDSQVLVSVVAVTGGQFIVNEVVLGAASGAQGNVVSWDGVTLDLSNVVGVFQVTEAISGADATGTVQSFQYVNTITNPSEVLDFSVFIPGYIMTIDGAPSNPYSYSNPVTILDVTGNVITVDTGGTPFVEATNQANIQLTQYVRYVAESGPNNCTTASRYITRPFTLTNPANSLHIAFTINRPSGSFVDCYYRILNTNSTKAFNTILWKKVELDAAVDSGVSSSPTQFKEFTYTANNIGSFSCFSVKLVMRGGNSSQVPKIQDFRAIALAI